MHPDFILQVVREDHGVTAWAFPCAVFMVSLKPWKTLHVTSIFRPEEVSVGYVLQCLQLGFGLTGA